MTPGPGEKFDYLLKGMKSRGKSLDSSVDTNDSRGDIPESESLPGEIQNLESRVDKEESRRLPKNMNIEEKSGGNSLESKVYTSESRLDSLDSDALEEAINEASKKPKLGVYSPLAAAMLRYKAITTPRYSMGWELRTVIEQALKEAYPQLYKEVQKRMKET
jgi:hypothetical protein